MSSHEYLANLKELLRLERMADQDYYRNKVLLRSLQQRCEEGTTWYPLRVKRDYIGTGERLMIEVERITHLQEAHAFSSGKSVNVFSNATSKPHKEHVAGVINYVRDDVMVITLNGEELPDWIYDGQLGVDVMFDEMSYREMEYALNEVMKATDNRVAELREILLGGKPATIDLAGSTDFTPGAGLNPSQIQAVERVLQCRDVAFIHGPPGTGKTTTIVAAIRQTLVTESQVLVSAASNAAVDLLAEKLSDQGVMVTRIGHPARVTEQTLGKTLDYRIASHPDYSELKSMRRKMEEMRRLASKYKRNYGYHEREQRKLLIQESKSLKADADLLEFHIISDLLNKSQVICCTLVGSSHPLLRGRKFQTVFIDEAGQALEPSVWIALLRSNRVVFAGDHQQLPPTIKSAEAARKGLALTLFERGITRYPEHSAQLQVQYRMNEFIMQFSSRMFYDNKLIAHPSVRNKLLSPYESPVEFIDTAGCGFNEAQDPETLSRFNDEEAAFLLSRLENLIEKIGAETWIDEAFTLGIITPYRAQVEIIHKLAEGSSILGAIGHLISINTVDAFQGQERDVIAISFVRSNDKGEVGFLNDLRRTNVAMTRARKKLVMVGDSATLGNNDFYLALVNWVQENSFYKSAFEWMNN